ncbi:MAG TPA: 2-amino-4-hydroxy-6-hydroxymethyldihydropteridine diphosphokinase [Chitinophagaceae bacterium]|nr:2-amino-4-hydroxy-6-hydroxymethyldihydropteridine diphosphokinase [Chitinophagaceae bacterium]
MAKLILIIGGNIGNRQRNFAAARKNIEKKTGKILRISALYETAAWGNTHQPDFLNQVLVVETKKTAIEVMKQILSIEKDMGRKRHKIKNAPRLIDIDILFYDKEIYNQPELAVPHPQIQNRRFVLIPLNELMPQFKHPVLNKTINQLLLNCKDKLEVKKLY